MLDKPTAQTVAPVGFRLLSSEVHDLTPEYLRDFRAIKATPTERELKDGRVKHLSEKAERGLLCTFHWVTATLNGEVKRLNGQHSSEMLQQRLLDGKFPTGMKVHREQFEVDNGQALALLFRQFDDRASGRSPLDISGVYQGLHPELHNVNRKVGKLAIDSYTWYQVNVEKIPGMLRGDDSYVTFNDKGLWPLIQWLNTLFQAKTAEMHNTSVVAAIIGTYLLNESGAKVFWQDVANLPNGDEVSTPQSILTNWLLAIRADKIERPSPAHLYQGCIYAWNAYRDNKSITAIRDDIKKNFLTIHE